MLVSWLFSSKVTLVSLSQLLKARHSMLVTLDGIVTLVSAEHSKNASFPMLVTPDGIVTLVSAEQL